MKDRVPANPGRVLITPENGGMAFYATMARADNPTQEGDPLNKNTLLKDATAALFGLGNDAVPDQALSAIKSILDSKAVIESVSYVGTGTFGENHPNTLTCSFAPKAAVMIGYMLADDNGSPSLFSSPLFDANLSPVFMLPVPDMPVVYTRGYGFGANGSGNIWGKRSEDGKTISWYNDNSGSLSETNASQYQMNFNGYTYYVLFIGQRS